MNISFAAFSLFCFKSFDLLLSLKLLGVGTDRLFASELVCGYKSVQLHVKLASVTLLQFEQRDAIVF